MATIVQLPPESAVEKAPMIYSIHAGQRCLRVAAYGSLRSGPEMQLLSMSANDIRFSLTSHKIFRPSA